MTPIQHRVGGKVQSSAIYMRTLCRVYAVDMYRVAPSSFWLEGDRMAAAFDGVLFLPPSPYGRGVGGEGMSRNLKNNQSNPFPGNPMMGISIRQKTANSTPVVYDPVGRTACGSTGLPRRFSMPVLCLDRTGTDMVDSGRDKKDVPRLTRGTERKSVSGRNSAVECQLPKLNVVGSTPIARFFVCHESRPDR